MYEGYAEACEGNAKVAASPSASLPLAFSSNDTHGIFFGDGFMFSRLYRLANLLSTKRF